jgi:streptomycin 6-kinase
LFRRFTILSSHHCAFVERNGENRPRRAVTAAGRDAKMSRIEASAVDRMLRKAHKPVSQKYSFGVRTSFFNRLFEYRLFVTYMYYGTVQNCGILF